MVIHSPNPGEPGGVTSPEYLTTLDSFVLWLRTQPRVVHAVSLLETLKRLNMTCTKTIGSSYCAAKLTTNGFAYALALPPLLRWFGSRYRPHGESFGRW